MDSSLLTTEIRPAVPVDNSDVLRTRDSWIGLKSFLLLVLALAVFSYFFGKRRSQLSIYFKSIFRKGERANLLDDTDVPIQRFQNVFLLYSIFIFVLYAILYLQNNAFPTLENTNVHLLWISLQIVFVYVISKFLLMTVYSVSQMSVRVRKDFFNHYIASINIIALILGILMFINELIGMSEKTIIWISVGTLILVKALFLPGTIRFFSAQRLSAFHFILYFCGLEILPVCILCKSIFLISQNIN